MNIGRGGEGRGGKGRGGEGRGGKGRGGERKGKRKREGKGAPCSIPIAEFMRDHQLVKRTQQQQQQQQQQKYIDYGLSGTLLETRI